MGDVADADHALSGLVGSRGGHEHHRVVEQAADLQRSRLLLADLDEGDVDIADLDGTDQICGLPGLTQHDLDSRPLRPEGPEEAGEDLGTDARKYSHPQLTLLAGGHR